MANMSIEDILKECKRVKNWMFTYQVDNDTSPGWETDNIDGSNGEIVIGASHTDMCSLWNRYSLYIARKTADGKSEILGKHTATHWARQEPPENYEKLLKAYYKIKDAHNNVINKGLLIWPD